MPSNSTIPAVSGAGAHVELYCDKDGSDKVYKLELVPNGSSAGPRFNVIGYNGPRGGTLTIQNKAINVSFEDAKKTFESVLREKLSPRKGYRVVESSAAAAPSIAVSKPTQEQSAHSPELVDHVSEQEAARYLKQDRWWLQRKRDGRRLGIHKLGPGRYVGVNKLGQVIGLDQSLIAPLEFVRLDSFLLDGEIEATGFYPWELLESNGVDLRSAPYEARYAMLDEHFAKVHKVLHVVETGRTLKRKTEMIEELRRIRAEGYILRDSAAAYGAGRSGNLKAVKWRAEASIIVGPKEAKKQDDGHRSVGMWVFGPDGKKLIYLGSVGIPDKWGELPSDGRVLDVVYLYAYHGSNHLIQAKFLGKFRDDVLPEECRLSQLKYKATE